MKFKVGDKVIPRKFSSDNKEGVAYNPYYMDKFIGKECKITQLYYFGYQLDYGWTWIEEALEPANASLEPQEYFYVGQEVYSPLFRNKERKAIVISIDFTSKLPVLCKGKNVYMAFTLDGKSSRDYDFISLFQEPIQFPVNKPIERFEEGEIVEYSNDGVHWGLGYFAGIDDDKEHSYKVCILKGMHDKLDSYSVWSKVKKFKK